VIGKGLKAQARTNLVVKTSQMIIFFRFFQDDELVRRSGDVEGQGGFP
jgi:hypothetical protein